MINISTSKQLDILLPNTNKALAEVLKTVTPQQLETLTEGKDIKSIISSLLQESAQSSKSDKVLLDLLKNNPTLKSLGNVSDTIKELLNTLKSDKNPLPIEKILKNFLVDIKQLSEPVLKQKIENSGIFLESKLKDVQNPQVTLKTMLESLTKILDKSELPAIKTLSNELKTITADKLLQNASNKELLTPIKNDSKAIEAVVKALETVLPKLQTQIKGADPIYSKEFQVLITKAEQLLNPKNLKSSEISQLLKPLNETISALSQTLISSKLPESKEMLGLLNNLMKTLSTITKSSQPLTQLTEQKVPQAIQNILDKLQIQIQKADPIFTKEVASLVEKASLLTAPQKLEAQSLVKDILANDLKSVLLQSGDEIAKSAHPNQSELLKQIDKLSLQIDYYQLMSHLSNASSLYLPFSWDQLEEGGITLKQTTDDKFYCDIDLKLKEHGDIKLRLALYDENQLNIHVYSDNEEFTALIKENIPSLRSALIDSEITPREIRILNAAKKSSASPYESHSNQLNMGFEVKV